MRVPKVQALRKCPLFFHLTDIDRKAHVRLGVMQGDFVVNLKQPLATFFYSLKQQFRVVDTILPW